MAQMRSSGSGRLLTGIAWAVLLVGLWLWGREIAGVPDGSSTTNGDVAAVGRPLLAAELPPAIKPLPEAGPHRVDIPSIGVQAPVIKRGLDGEGAIAPPPYDQAGVVGWYAGGVKPGAKGTALFVGHVDTESRPAVFYNLSTLKPGEKVRVTRADGTVAEFTVEEVAVYDRSGFDPHKAYGVRHDDRAELRLITCGGTFDRATKTYSSNVVASAFLTGKGP
ncbi:class F sortase [Streptomyces sp. YC504]|uniref:Class F sortase n=1 Tax=Streptomyces mesophilus TaxID=1775132 RepID=A0A6G4XRS8_9ACTN|nr:class F sortase [Streptomyces mesophilus]NGO79311.1 class F sortase [Streptomyces mesophilus]